MKRVDRIDGLERTSHLPAVAEPATLLAGRMTRFICRKRTYNGITIALAREGFPWSESAEVLRKNDLYRFVTNDIQPAHNTFNTLRKRLGLEGFVEIHKRFVLKAHSLGLLEPEIPDLPKHRKKGIILVADSTFLITCGSTKGEKDGQGRWRFKDENLDRRYRITPSIRN
ncbi:hypothetical protein D4S03_07980 [bacterium]|nr:MAG: hypothetical protein D4S03_07980 [bacterium]